MGECSFWYRPTRVVPDQRPLNGRCWGDRPPFGGDMNFAGLHFGLLFLKKLPADFGIFKPIASIYRLLAILRFKKIVSHVTQINFVQSW